jgi:hypothetical protein
MEVNRGSEGEFDGEFEGLEVEEVAGETPSAGSAHRDPAGGTFFESGRFVLNTDAAGQFYKLVQDRGYDPANCRASYGRVPGSDMVTIYARRHDDPGTADVRLNADGKTITVYLHSLLEKHPDLRPATKQYCKIGRSKDKKGVPCLVFHASGGLDKRTQKRGSGGSDGQAAAGQQK